MFRSLDLDLAERAGVGHAQGRQAELAPQPLISLVRASSLLTSAMSKRSVTHELYSAVEPISAAANKVGHPSKKERKG